MTRGGDMAQKKELPFHQAGQHLTLWEERSEIRSKVLILAMRPDSRKRLTDLIQS